MACAAIGWSRVQKRKGRKMKSLCGVLAAMSFMLVACGGGGGGGNSAPTQAAQPAPPKAVSIMQLGDSTTWGQSFSNGAYSQTPNSAPVVLQISLRASYGSTVTVANNGVGSSTIGDQVNGTLPDTSTLVQLIQSSTAQIVTANFGINDSAPYGNETPAQFQTYLENFVDTVRAFGKIPVLEEPNPVGTPTFAGVDGTTYAQLPNYVAVINAVAAAKNVPIVQQYAYIQSLPGWQSMLTDGVHPNDALYKIKADREAAIIGPIVAKFL